jgi:hypothetical protein
VTFIHSLFPPDGDLYNTCTRYYINKTLDNEHKEKVRIEEHTYIHTIYITITIQIIGMIDEHVTNQQIVNIM